MKGGGVSGGAVVGQVVVERVEHDIGPRDLGGQDRENLLKILPRIQDLRHGRVDLLWRGAARRIHVQQVVSDGGNRDELGLRLDDPEDVVHVVGLVDQEIVSGLSKLRRLVQRGAGGGNGTKHAGLDLLGVPKRSGGRAEVEVPGDAVPQSGDPERSGQEMGNSLIELGEAGLPDGRAVARRRSRKSVPARRGEAPAGRVGRKQQVTTVCRREQEGPRGVSAYRHVGGSSDVARSRQAHRDAGQDRLPGIPDAVPVTILEGMSRDVLGQGQSGEDRQDQRRGHRPQRHGILSKRRCSVYEPPELPPLQAVTVTVPTRARPASATRYSSVTSTNSPTEEPLIR